MSAAASVGVIGAGGHAKVVVATLLAAGFEVAGLFDSNAELWGRSVLGVEVVGGTETLFERGISSAVLAVGDNRRRSELAGELAARGLDWPAVVHPSAVVHESAEVGAGSVVFAGALIQPDSRVGSHSIVNTGASLDHDCALGDFVHLAPGTRLAGGVTVGAGAFLGVGCSVLPGVKIGEWAVVGAGAAVIRDVEAGRIVKGVPAR